MFRFVCCLALVGAAASLSCWSGQTYAGTAGKQSASTPDNTTSIRCGNATQYCVRETVDLQSPTAGTAIKAVNYNCDVTNMCTTYIKKYVPNKDCLNVGVGNICCCTSDNCNRVPTTKSVQSVSVVAVVMLPALSMLFRV